VEIDGHQFRCTQCGDCCRWEGFVLLDDEDIKRLRNKENLSHIDFIAKFTRQIRIDGKYKMALVDKKGSNECIYLKGNKCSVYDIRPKQCSEYPIKFDSKCEGFDVGEKNMKLKYEESVKNVNEKLAGGKVEKELIANLFRGLDKNKKVASVLAQASESGLDVYLKDDKVKIASLSDLYAFTRVDDNHLIHKATKDLWSLEANSDGSVTINRLFDDSGNPLRS